VALRELEVSAADAGSRLDRYVRTSHPALSRRALDLLFEGRQVLHNGRPGKKGDRVEMGDHVAFDPTYAEVTARPAPAADVQLVLVTADFVVMDKPGGIPSGAVPGRLDGTAAGQLLSLFPEIAEIGYGPHEPGLVHRLDTQTSGLLLAARTPEAFSLLRTLMQSGGIVKRYLAIARGIAPEEGRIELGLEPDPHDERRVRVTTQNGVPRTTTFRRLESKGGHSLLEVTLARGYRHQIRAHLASAGLPLAGDVLYGGQPDGLAPRHALHASYIATESGMLRFRAESELPGDLRAFWSRVGDPD
jgi:23S rRNA pseudouridine1911/1915/1917 synthase